jgi:hypothetical protein
MCERAVLTNRPSLGLSPFVLEGQEPAGEPCNPLARKTLPRPPHPSPRRNDRDTPLMGWDAKSSRCDLGQVKTKIFLQRGLDGPNQIEKSQQIAPGADQ